MQTETSYLEGLYIARKKNKLEQTRVREGNFGAGGRGQTSKGKDIYMYDNILQ